MKKMWKSSNWLRNCIESKWVEKLIFPLILLVYPLRHIMFGVEWWDTAYNYGNFVYMDHMDPMWRFSTYLANTVGRFMTGLPFGDRMLGMNMYTGLLVSILALSGYYFFIRIMKLKSFIVFAGEVLAISLCWCPTSLLYNYLTYILMGAGVTCLYMGLTAGEDHSVGRVNILYFMLAGICFSVNVLVRFPNLVQMGFIVAVWVFGVIKLVSWKVVAVQTCWCVLGYVLGLGLCFGYLSLRYGAGEYILAITRLLNMPAEATSYSFLSMVEYQIRNYIQNFKWLSYLIGFTGLGIIGFCVFPGKLLLLKRVGYVACVFAGFYFLRMRNMFNMTYHTKMSVFQWAVFLLSATIIVGVITIFRSKQSKFEKGEASDSKNNRKVVEFQKEKLWAGISILIILFTPLGSDNHLYSSINNLFFVAPFTLYLLIRFLKWLPHKMPSLYFPIKAMIVCMMIMLGVQSLCFGAVYVFSESDGGQNLNTRIDSIPTLKGMYTDPERAEVLNSLFAYVEKEDLQGKEIILYGNIPSLSYYLQMPFAISAWPDLRSYNYEVMERELEDLAAYIDIKGREVPMLLLEAKYGTYLKGGEAALQVAGLSEAEIVKIVEDRKFALLADWIERYEYDITFENEKFIFLRRS